jgi:tetratricopeptide (TPR) repeat protein
MEAINHFNNALGIYEQIEDIRGKADGYERLGLVYTIVGEHKKAIECLNKALRFYIQVGDLGGMACVYQGLSSVYTRLNDEKNAMKYSDKATKTEHLLEESRKNRRLF